MRKNFWIILSIPISWTVLYGVYILAMFVIYDFDKNFLKIDSCLDSGGSWDYEKCECITKASPSIKTADDKGIKD